MKINHITQLENKISFWLHKTLKSKRESRLCCISLSKKGFKVITLYQIFRGYKTEGEPIYFLPFTTSEDELTRAIFDCLGKSCTIMYTPSISTTDYLRFIKERSLKSYYASSVECTLELNPNTSLITFNFWQQVKNGRGTIPCKDQSLTVKYQKGNELHIAQYINKILKEKLTQKETE